MSVDVEKIELSLPEGSAAHMSKGSLARYRAFMQREPLGAHSDWHQVDAYKARLVQLDMSLLGKFHALTMSVFWPHRPADLALPLQVGSGWLALDEIDRPLSSAMGVPCGDDFAILGLMATTPRLQAYGSGSRLLRRILKKQAGRDLRLVATRQGYPLYQVAGFANAGLVHQHQGIARAVRPPQPVPGVHIRPFAPSDMAALDALDLHAYGASRKTILRSLDTVSDVIVAERRGSVEGFAMSRPFGKGRVIGPLVAEQGDVAMMLAAEFFQAHAGTFLRLDTIVEDEAFEAFVSSAGLSVFNIATDMRLGRLRRALTGPQTFALAMQALG
ncbi:hypothetical protein [uncultured Ruegeria sp.]|uniref:hypothetical protein n=1 Tax=uncultured Ruegeria sp. TaxID=259304 RepID=UPI002601EA7D|nr:hypothetical protein [uncultured Ruegeria sp.]